MGERYFNAGNVNISQTPSMQARTTCTHCGRQHLGECRGISGGCYFCGKQGHFVRDYPKRVNVGQAMSEPTVQNTGTRGAGTFFTRNKGKGVGQSEAQSSKPPTQARVFALTRDEAVAAPEVITGKVLLQQLEAYVLIDPGSTHSFLSSKMASHMHTNHDMLDHRVSVLTPLGEVVILDKVYRDCCIQIGESKVYADLIVLPILEFDIILSMDWLSRHRARVDYTTTS